MFLNQENRNRKQKRVFPTFHDKNTFLFLDTSKRRKKRTRVEKKKKKRRVIKTRNHFSRHRKRPNMEKRVKKKPKRKGNRENEVFLW